ncbi:MAG: uracil-DNA glycosylase [Burkholderiales bacterium 28-67-8]|nr:MAG: uracil-DNA glycosylase [Burkholderiales bacterium 28-67-8]
MVWSERQRAMLEVMGLRVWSAPAAAEPDAAAATGVDEAVPSVAPARSPAREDESVSMAPARDNVSMPAPVVSRRPTPAAQPTAVPVAAPGAVNAAGLDWPALREAVASCTACALSDSRTQTVFGTGHPHAHWMIVGEAPGEAEDLSGEPFVGRSGQLLDNMLRAIGLSRHAGDTPDPAKQVFIANTLKCRPPRNRNPLPDELARCEGFLIRQIELVRPKIILAMGSFAVQSLLRSSAPVGQLRGRVHRYQGVPLIVTYHPAYLLRQQTEKARAWDDLCLALDTVEAAGSIAARG